MKNIKLYFAFIILAVIQSNCSYLDIVPDNVATIDNAFTMRSTAEKYLFTCYRYMPSHASLYNNPAWTAGDEFWFPYPSIGVDASGINIARGNQNASEPYLNYWDSFSTLFVGIRDCNIFLENIGKVPDMPEPEKLRWIAEVKFLKAYYHFWLLRMYGPIPVIRENLPVSASVEEVKVYREPIDDCVKYIVQLLDEAARDLPRQIDSELTELGRITKPIALSVKALVLVTSASPLFNGNTDYTGFTDNKGTALFNSTYQEDKWKQAAEACKAAIQLCDSVGFKLYTFKPGISSYTLSKETLTQMSIRNSVCEKWNSEVIWANTNSSTGTLQRQATPYGLDPAYIANENVGGNLAPPLKIVKQFYTKNGVPLSEDKTLDFSNTSLLRVATPNEKFCLQPGYTTATVNFDREPRFYADLAFDGGVWYGNGKLDDTNPWPIKNKVGQLQVRVSINRNCITGYWPKKLVHYENIIGASNAYTIQDYAWPEIRLADLYLLYSESLNEANGPTAEVYRWINLVRERAGLLSVEESWTQFSNNPGKCATKEGLRDIIQQERLIELAFEGHRFWDLLRWKRAQTEMNKPITAWNVEQSDQNLYYRELTLFKPTFLVRDYLWPIKENNILVNPNLVQNPGW